MSFKTMFLCLLSFCAHCPHIPHHTSLHPTPDQAICRACSFYWAMPMTPQAGRAPALPVVLLSSCPPLPKSSVPACTTMVRPRTLSGPISLTCSSVMEPFALPWPSVLKLPRSPTWRSLSAGAPCVLEKGLTG